MTRRHGDTETGGFFTASPRHLFWKKSAHRANSRTFQATRTAGFGQSFIHESRDAGFKTPLGELQDSQPNPVLADPDATATEQAFVWIEEQGRVAAVYGEVVNQMAEAIGPKF